MEFRDVAVKETEARVTALLANASKRSLVALESFRETLNVAVEKAQQALIETADVDRDATIGAMVERLTVAAQAHADQSTARVSAEADTALEALRKDLQTAADEQRQAAEALELLRGEINAVRSALEREQNDAASVRAELSKARDDHASSEAARQTAEAACLRETRAKVILDQELQELRSMLASTQAEAAEVVIQLETEAAERAKIAVALSTARKRSEDAEAQRLKLTQQLESAAALIASLEASHNTLKAETPTAAPVDHVRLASQPLDGLISAFQKLESSESVADILNIMAGGLATAFKRVAILKVRGNCLEGVEQIGFDTKNGVSKVVAPLSLSSMLTEAVSSRRIQSRTGRELTEAGSRPFGGTPSFVVVLPIAVNDEVIAVIYADDSGQVDGGATLSKASYQMKFAQLVLWQAVPRLPRLLREEKARSEMHDYATAVLEQIQKMYTADIQSGKTQNDLKASLREHVDCARQMYADRAASVGATDTARLEQYLEAFLEEQRGTPFGRDLAGAIAPPTNLTRKNRPRHGLITGSSA